MDYVKAFWVGGLICACDSDSAGSNQADAGTHYGTVSVQWSSTRILWRI